MDQDLNSPEMKALLEMLDTQKETGATIMAQIIELHASMLVLLDLQKLTLKASGHYEDEELDSYCASQMSLHRRMCLENLKQNVAAAKQLLQDDKGPPS